MDVIQFSATRLNSLSKLSPVFQIKLKIVNTLKKPFRKPNKNAQTSKKMIQIVSKSDPFATPMKNNFSILNGNFNANTHGKAIAVPEENNIPKIAPKNLSVNDTVSVIFRI